MTKYVVLSVVAGMLFAGNLVAGDSGRIETVEVLHAESTAGSENVIHAFEAPGTKSEADVRQIGELQKEVADLQKEVADLKTANAKLGAAVRESNAKGQKLYKLAKGFLEREQTARKLLVKALATLDQ